MSDLTPERANRSCKQHAAREIGRYFGTNRSSDLRMIERRLERLLRDCRPMVEPTPATHPKQESEPTDLYAPARHESKGYICIPFVGKSKRYDALRRSITFAADQSVMSEWQGARVMTFFLQAIADEVATGNPVRIPGLGMFTPWCWTAKNSGKQTMQPRFVPSRVFRLQVKHFCPVSDAMNKQSESYRRSHHPSSRKHDYGSTRAAMQHWRASIDRMFIPPSR